MHRLLKVLCSGLREENQEPHSQEPIPPSPRKLVLPKFRLYLCLIARCVFCIHLGLLSTPAIPGLAQESTENSGESAPLDFGQSQNGFSQLDTMPTIPGDSKPEPMPYYDPSQQPSSGRLDQTPKGLFLEIVTAEGFEEELEFRRGHLYYPIRPTARFKTNALAVFVVFRVFKHYAPYQVIGRVFPEDVAGLPADQWTDEDAAYLALEDESGYLKLFPPSDQGWKPGRYRVEIFVGYEANALNQMGTLHFTMLPHS